MYKNRRGVTVQTVKGSKKLFGSRSGDGDAETSASLIASAPLRMGRPLALADDSVGDYLKAVGATPPGVRSWTQGLGLGLLGSLALQDLCGPLVEGLLSTQIKQFINRR